MTDTNTTHGKADALANALRGLMDDAEARERKLSDALRTIDRPGDDPDPELALAIEALEDARNESEELSEKLDKLADSAWDVSSEAEDAHYEWKATSDLAGIALDVERGIRDHAELMDACRATAGSYLL